MSYFVIYVAPDRYAIYAVTSGYLLKEFAFQALSCDFYMSNNVWRVTLEWQICWDLLPGRNFGSPLWSWSGLFLMPSQSVSNILFPLWLLTPWYSSLDFTGIMRYLHLKGEINEYRHPHGMLVFPMRSLLKQINSCLGLFLTGSLAVPGTLGFFWILLPEEQGLASWRLCA